MFKQKETHYQDLSTRGVGINPEAAPLVYNNPSIEQSVPGWEVKGTIENASYVMRFPESSYWNGKIMIGATPAVRNAYSLDLILSDLVMQKGYAYAVCDKATPGFTLRDPMRSMEEWFGAYFQLTESMKNEVAKRYGQSANKIYISGVSNGGYVTRSMLERYPQLYHGGVEWEGALWAPDVRHLLSTVADYVEAYPVYADLRGGTVKTERHAAYEKLLTAGLHPESEPFWKTYYQTYWLISLWLYGRNLDPEWEPFKQEWSNEWVANPSAIFYPWKTREAQLYERTGRLWNTGKLTKPLLSVAGNWDCLLPFEYHAKAYAIMVEQAGAGKYHRLYEIERGNHVDGLLLYDKGNQQPVHPYYEATLNYFEKWVEDNALPPDSGAFSDIQSFYSDVTVLKSLSGKK